MTKKMNRPNIRLVFQHRETTLTFNSVYNCEHVVAVTGSVTKNYSIQT